MKIKSFATLAVSGLIAGYVAYVAPAMADYSNVSNPSMQTNSPDNNNNQNNPNSQNNSPSVNQNLNNNPNNVDQQATPDTATGDDDY